MQGAGTFPRVCGQKCGQKLLACQDITGGLGILILVRIMEVRLTDGNAIVLISGGLVRCLVHDMRRPLKKRGNAASGSGKLPS
jgi:hypothetical protein